MKINFKSIILFAVMGSLFTSCEYDNYKEPSANLKGALLYNNVDTVFVQQSSGTDINGVNVYFNLFEPGAKYANWKSTPIRVVVDASGNYSSMLFADKYKMVLPVGIGPFLTNTDTTEVTVTGNQTMNIPVIPYYLVRNFAPTLNPTDSLVSTTVKIDQIVTDSNAKTIGSVWLYINRTIIVDGGTNLASANIGGGDIKDLSTVTLTAKLPNLAKIGGLGISNKQKQFFVRVGVRINGSTEVFSSLRSITLP